MQSIGIGIGITKRKRRGGFLGSLWNGAEVSNFDKASSRTLSAANQSLAFSPGQTFWVVADQGSITGGNNEVIVGCYTGSFGAGKGFVMEYGQNTGSLAFLNWAGTYTIIGLQRLGVRRIAVTWKASDNTLHFCRDGETVIVGAALATPTYDASCVSVIGTPAGAGGVTDDSFLTGGVSSVGILDREMSDAELVALTSPGVGNRFDVPEAFSNDPDCLVDLNIYRDWDGVSSSIVSEGTAPSTLSIVGAISKIDVSEVYYASITAMYADSEIAASETYATGKTCTRRNTYARLSFTTDGIRAAIHQVSTIQASYTGHYAAIGVNSNGTYSTEGQNTLPNFEQITDVTLPAGVGKSIDLVEGPQAIISAAIKGTYIVGFRIPVGSTVTTPVVPENVLVPIGDSAADGFLGVIPHSDGWTNVLRALYYGGAGNVACHCVGSMGIYHLTVDAPTQAEAVAMAVAMARRATIRKIIYIELAANDYYQNLMSAAAYQTKLSSYVADIYAADPTIEIFFQTAIPIVAPANENANGSGSTLGDYRTAMTAVYTAFAGTKQLLDGTTLISVGNIGPDGIHPTSTGQAEIAGNVDAVVNF